MSTKAEDDFLRNFIQFERKNSLGFLQSKIDGNLNLTEIHFAKFLTHKYYIAREDEW